MKKKTKKLTYIILAVFLVSMIVMTIVSRIMNESHIPIVETQTPRSASLVLDAIGRGVIRLATGLDTKVQDGLFEKDTYYVEGYFFDKEYVENTLEGSKIQLSIDGKKVEGTLVTKVYNYREDTIDVVISLPQEKDYVAGNEIEFVLENTKVKYPCCIAKDLIYEEDGTYYVYLLKERDSILGNVTIAVKTQIHIIAQNKNAAAISEEFGKETEIIAKGVKLEDGIKVRKKEW